MASTATSLAEQNGWEQCALNPDGTLKDAESIDFGHDPGADDAPLGGKYCKIILPHLIYIFVTSAVEINNTLSTKLGMTLNENNLIILVLGSYKVC